jgi:UDP-glucose 4-epimerase
MCWGKRERLAGVPHTLPETSVLELPKVAQQLQGVTHVFHLAALISAYESLEQPDRYLTTNVFGTLRVLELCEALTRPRLVFASTSGIYGNSAGAVKRESDLPSPATVYASTKLTGEQLLSLYRERFDFDDVSLRFFNVYGPGQSPKHPYANVTCRFSRAAALGEAVDLYGDGAQTRDFVYIDDVLDAVMAAATRPTASRLYNIGTGQDASIATLLEQVQLLSGAQIEVRRHAPWPNDIRHIRADISLAQRELGFAPQVSLRDGLARTIEFFRSAGRDF